MDDEQLIDLVKSFPLIYDKRNAEYKDREKKRLAWTEISKNMGADESTVMKRWGNLRERFSKEMRNPRNSSGSRASLGKQWPLFDSLQFLRDHIIPRPMRQSAPLVEVHAANSLEDETCQWNEEFLTISDSMEDLSTQSSTFSSQANKEDLDQTSTSSSSKAKKRKKELDELDSTIMETMKTFQDACARKARREEYSSFGAMICSAISKMKKSTQAIVMRQCTNIVMDAQISENEGQ
ncbi:uncharacterized protein [Musca autumnalis]|uniref:uncharacterized protein n=1 Tax=Musca autumnalis TaxID=221902 RepID=UPI003CF4AA25